MRHPYSGCRVLRGANLESSLIEQRTEVIQTEMNYVERNVPIDPVHTIYTTPDAFVVWTADPDFSVFLEEIPRLQKHISRVQSMFEHI